MDIEKNYFMIDQEEIYRIIAGSIEFWKKKDFPQTKVVFDTGNGKEDMKVEFQGASGMQILGMAHLLAEWSKAHNKEPMYMAIRIGSISEMLGGFMEDFKKDKQDDLVIKFNGED